MDDSSDDETQQNWANTSRDPRDSDDAFSDDEGDEDMVDASSLPQVPKNLPNVLITGTPGTGKTTTAELISSMLPNYRHVNVGDVVREKGLHHGRDQEFDAFLINEDAVVDELEEQMVQGGNIIDFHSCDFFPERWIQLVIVLRTDNSVLYQRLQARNYSVKKVTENIEAEILQVVLDEARDSYDNRLVWELDSNNVAEQERNAERIVEWIKSRMNGECDEEADPAEE